MEKEATLLSGDIKKTYDSDDRGDADQFSVLHRRRHVRRFVHRRAGLGGV